MAVNKPKETSGGRGRKRAVNIEGIVYESVSEAARKLQIPTPTVFQRIYSRSPEYLRWSFVDNDSVPRNSSYRYRFVDWVVYTLTHLPSGKVYVGMTGNFVARKATHRHNLKTNGHKTPQLQALFNEDPDWGNWEWFGYIVADKDEAVKMEQLKIDEFHSTGRLLNQSLDGKAPIAYLMRNEENLRRQREGTKRYVELNPGLLNARAKLMCETRWSSSENRKAWCGAGNPFAKRVMVDGVIYGSVKDAQRELKINEKTIRTRCRDPKYPNYTFDVPQS